MQKIIVAAGVCTPARNHVKTALDPYGVKYSIGADIMIGADGNIALAMTDAYHAEVDVYVSDRAAAWAEYLLLRSGKLQLVSRPLDARNRGWAEKWAGRMPSPWVESGCNPAKGIVAGVVAKAKKAARRVVPMEDRRAARRARRRAK